MARAFLFLTTLCTYTQTHTAATPRYQSRLCQLWSDVNGIKLSHAEILWGNTWRLFSCTVASMLAVSFQKWMVVKLNGVPCDEWLFGIVGFFLSLWWRRMSWRMSWRLRARGRESCRSIIEAKQQERLQNCMWFINLSGTQKPETEKEETCGMFMSCGTKLGCIMPVTSSHIFTSLSSIDCWISLISISISWSNPIRPLSCGLQVTPITN